MTRQNYVVDYRAFNEKGQIIKKGTMRCKNKLSEFDAQAGLEKHFEKTLVGFKRLEVLSCKVDNPFDWSDIFKRFK